MPDIDSLLSAILGPVNNTLEGVMDSQPSDYRRMNPGFPLSLDQRAGNVGMGKPGAPTTSQLAISGLLNALGGIAPGRGTFTMPARPVRPNLQDYRLTTGNSYTDRRTGTTYNDLPRFTASPNEVPTTSVPEVQNLHGVTPSNKGPNNSTLRRWEQSNYLDWNIQVPRVVENIQAGRSIANIANDLNVAPEVLSNVLSSRGIVPEFIPIRRAEPMPQFSENVSRAADLIRQGRTIGAITRELGVPRDILNRELRNSGMMQRLANEGVTVNTRTSALSLSQRRRVIREAAGDNVPYGTQSALAREFGLSRAAITNIVNRHRARLKK